MPSDYAVRIMMEVLFKLLTVANLELVENEHYSGFFNWINSITAYTTTL